MALVLADRVKESCTSPGTGTVTLLGAALGYVSFAVIGDGNTTYYCIADQGGANWEVGVGTYTASGTTLSRDTVLSNSLGTTAKINFASGSQDVFVTYPAERSIYVDGSSIVPATTASLSVANGGTGQTTYTDGQLLIGNTTGNTLTKSTLTQGTGITITNGSGSISIANASPMTYPGAGIAVSTGSAWGTSKTAPTGDIVGTTDTQTLTNKTLTDPAIIGTILEDVYTITDGAAFEIDPGNGSIQLITLGASRTPKATNFASGEAVTLMVDDGSAYTLTWTDATFGGSGVVWETNGGTAPTLATSGYTTIVLWKVGSQVYGARVGDA